jgi:hypothetical protein
MKNIPDSMVNFHGEIEDEIWKDFPIKPFNLKYEVSNYGRILSKEKTINILHPKTKLPWSKKHKKKLRKTRKNLWGYFQIALKIGTTEKNATFQVHRIVALAFLPNDENKPMVNHIDGIKHNNHVSNLEWVTAKENTNHSMKNGFNKLQEHNSRMVTKRGVYQLDKTTEQIIREFDSIIEASKFINAKSNGIIISCKNPSKSCKGYKWKYVDNGHPNKIQKFVQIDPLTNEVIKFYESLNDLRNDFKRNRAIIKVCEGTPYFKTSYGFKWKFKDQYDQEQQDKKNN